MRDVLHAATLSTQDLDAAVTRYRRWFGYILVEAGVVSEPLASHWGAEATIGQRFAVMQPASGAAVYLRFLETEPTPGYSPLRTYGWAALELCVQDVHAADRQIAGGPFEVIGPPALNPGLAAIHPMQVKGPDGEIVFLTQTQVGGPSARHPVPKAPIDTLFILVLACERMADTAVWFVETLGLNLGATLTLPYSVLSDAFGLPQTFLHQLQTADIDGRVLLEFDVYPKGAAPRPVLPGHLPPGISIGTFVRSGLNRLDVDWIEPPARQPSAFYGGAKTGVVRGPEGTLIELIEPDR